MRNKLARSGTDIPATATYINIVDLYEDSKESGPLSLPTDYSTVIFPLEPSSVLYVSQNKLQHASEPKQMKDINHFIHDDNISASSKAKLVTIMASFVDLSPLSSHEKEIGDHWKSLIAKPLLHMAQHTLQRRSEER